MDSGMMRKCVWAATAMVCATLLAIGSVAIAKPAIAYAETSPISMTKSSLSVDVDDTVTVYLSGASTDAAKWTSSNEDAAVIESSTTRKAVVKGIGVGTSEIKAADADGNEAVCTVTVAAPTFSIDGSVLTVVDETEYLYVQEGEAATWESSNADIVSIASQGSSSATIRAESVGTAIITATDKYGSTSKCTVKVRQEAFSLRLQENYGGDYEDEASFTSYWQQHDESGWWDNDYNYHESYTWYDSLGFYALQADEGTIVTCTSANKNVVSVVKEDENYYLIYPKGVGKTVVTAVDPYGEEETIQCRVTKDYFLDEEGPDPDDEYSYAKEYSYKNLKYGDSTLKGVTYDNAAVTATINGRTYSGKAGSSGSYSIKVPKYVKIGTSVTIRTTQYGFTETHARKVVNNKPSISLSSVKKGSKKVSVTVKKVHKGDYIKVKVGKKTYTKKVTKDYKEKTYQIKTKVQKKGQKVTVKVYNKYKQKLTSKSRKVK